MPDLSKTRDQLIERAAKNLGIIEPGEALSTEDYDTFDGLVDPLIAQLAADQIVYIDNDEEIANEYFMPLARLLANMAGPDFGSAINEEAKRTDENTLKRLTATKPTYAAAEGQYY